MKKPRNRWSVGYYKINATIILQFDQRLVKICGFWFWRVLEGLRELEWFLIWFLKSVPSVMSLLGLGIYTSA